ncbi:MAG: hypothetical protein AB1916_13080 [Thermodesulfobacteriota bacterium]
MRKKWLALALVFSFVAAAVTAQAASVPSRLNGSTWNFTAFQLATQNGYGKANPSVVNATLLQSTYTYDDSFAGNTVGGLNGTAYVWNSTYGYTGNNTLAWFKAAGNGSAQGGTNIWRVGRTFGGQNELLSLESQISTLPGSSGALDDRYNTYFIANTDLSLMAGLSNRTIYGTDEGLGALGNLYGPQLGLLVQNLTITNNTTDVVGSWHLYSLSGNYTNSTAGTLEPHIAATAGKMTLSSDGTGTYAYYTFNGTGTIASSTSDTLIWGVNPGSRSISVNSTALGGLVIDGMISQNKKFMIGVNATQNGAGNANAPVGMSVALRDAGAFSSSDFQSGAYKFANLIKGGAQANTNGSLGVIYATSAGTSVQTGNMTTTNGTTVGETSLNSKTISVASTTLAGVSHGNMTMNGRNFIGAKTSNTLAGIVLDTANNVLGLQIMVPAGSTTSEPAPVSTAELTTFTNTSLFTVTAANGTTTTIEAGTGSSVAALNSDLDAAISAFTNATDTTLASNFSLGSSQTIDRNFPTVTFARTGFTTGAIYLSKITFSGNNKLISQLPTPTKFYVNATSANAANSTRQFTYRNYGSAITDGSWWVSVSGTPNLTFDYNYATPLPLGSSFDLWLAIQDNGRFDLDPTNGQIVDPGLFVGGSAGGGGLAGGGDDGGCVLNPAAGVSVELLLLLLAPLAYFIRRKK